MYQTPAPNGDPRTAKEAPVGRDTPKDGSGFPGGPWHSALNPHFSLRASHVFTVGTGTTYNLTLVNEVSGENQNN